MAQSVATYTRRRVLMLGGAALVSGALRWFSPSQPRDDANDFPVASYHPPEGPVDIASWRLGVTGAVANPLSLSYSDLVSLPRQRHRYALACITGWSSTQEWEGIPVSALVGMASPAASYLSVRLTAADGYNITLGLTRCESPRTMVVTHVAGAPLSHDHGFPARLMMPDVVGVEDVKWLTGIEVLGA